MADEREIVESERSEAAEHSTVVEHPETYTEAKAQLDEIVKQVRAKDITLEKSLDLLEEGVRLANQCTELIDQTRWDEAEGEAEGSPESISAETPEAEDDEDAAHESESDEESELDTEE